MQGRLRFRNVPIIHGNVVTKHEAAIDAIKLSRCMFVRHETIRVRRALGGYRVSFMPTSYAV